MTTFTQTHDGPILVNDPEFGTFSKPNRELAEAELRRLREARDGVSPDADFEPFNPIKASVYSGLRRRVRTAESEAA